MRKFMKQASSGILAAAMVLTAAGIAPTAGSVQTAKAADALAEGTTYNGYVAFQLGGSWASRAEWNNKEAGRDDVRTSATVTVNDVQKAYKYASQYIVNCADDKTVIYDGQIKDAVMGANQEYSVEIGNFPSTTFGGASTNTWNMLHISTDIPLTVKGVTCTNIKVYFDGETTPYITLAQAPYNTQKSTNGDCYDFFITDTYASTHGTKTAYDCKKMTRFPTKSLKVEYTLGGVNFAELKVEIPVLAGPMAGAKVESGDLAYTVVTRAMSDKKTAGTVNVSGMSTAGASKTEATVPQTITTAEGYTYNVIAVADSAFSGNKTLQKITLGSKIASVGKNAFNKATKLSSISFNSDCKTIGASAFAGCTALKSVSLPTNLTSLGKSAFAKCTKLTKIKFSAKMTSISESTFSGCKSLKAVTLGKKIKKIGKSAFAKCTKLAKITAYQKLKVTKKAFTGCKKTIKVKGKSAAANKKAIKKAGYKKVK